MSILFLFLVSIVDFRPLFELLSKIVGANPLKHLKTNMQIPVDKHGFDRQPFQFYKNMGNVIKFLQMGYNPSCEVLDIL